MKFVVIKSLNGTKLSIVHEGLTYDVYPKKNNTNLLDAINNFEEIKENEEKILSTRGELFNRGKTTFPFLPLGKIICLGLNYLDHVKEGGYEVPSYPALFVRFPSSLIEPNQKMIKPKISEKLDYEAELMVLIGKKTKDVDEKEAEKSVFAYTVFNDGSVRDYQKKTHQWTPGKNFDGTGAMGSIYVTPDEVPLGASGLKIQSKVNNQVMQEANTSEMMWPVFKTISTLSKFATLEKGDLIVMGTPPGVGHARNPAFFLKEGDIVETIIDKIDHITNKVVNE
jgi:2-keto-4-pentenoate hydratase/2-oxohepta-3-ene-1,7-dioic acid hydratase in catechol pathway|tara:strand:- start:649 stop:1494 length:846 start_codon:yes stop_codon:yes gene_type:complete